MDTKSEKILKTYRIIYDYKQEQKEAGQSASETFKALAEELSTDPKTYVKELREGYRCWVKRNEGDPTIDNGIEIADLLSN